MRVGEARRRQQLADLAVRIDTLRPGLLLNLAVANQGVFGLDAAGEVVVTAFAQVLDAAGGMFTVPVIANGKI